MPFTASKTPFSSMFLFLVSICFMPSYVLGHGYVQNVNIAGKSYTGWLPFTMPYTSPVGKSIVRNVPDDGPVLDITSPDLACNVGGQKPAALIANANAGDVVKLTMNTWPADHVGPVTVYMANCGGDCMSFNPTKGNVWFKVDQDGMTNGVWGTLKLISQGNSWSVTIPPSIKAGQYLLRLEILALHNANQPQFYPSCTQLNIKSSGSSVPSSSDLVAIPGVYSSAGKAIHGDVWSGTPTSWPVAGPAVVSWATGSGSGGGDSGKGQTTSTSEAASQTPKAKPTTTTTPAATRIVTTATDSQTPATSAPNNIMPPIPKGGSTTTSSSTPTTSAGPKHCRNKKRSGLVAKNEAGSNKLRRAQRNERAGDHESPALRNETPAFDAKTADPETIVLYERAKRYYASSHAGRNLLRNKRGATGMRVRHA